MSLRDEVDREVNELKKNVKFKYADTLEYEHLDGTRVSLTNAELRWLSITGWFAIFSEHNGVVVNHRDDLKWMRRTYHKYVWTTKEEQE